MTLGDLPSFYALEPRWFTLNRFYKIYVGADSLFLVKVGGQFFDEGEAQILTFSIPIIGFLFAPWLERIQEKRRKLESESDRFDFELQDIERLTKDNRRIHYSDIVRAELSHGNSLGDRAWTTGSLNGRLRLGLSRGRNIRLLITEQEHSSEIGPHLANRIPGLRVF